MSVFVDIRGPIEIPEFEDYEPSNLRLSWKRPEIPAYEKTAPTYQIETWRPKERDWHPYVSKLTEPSYKLTDLDRYRDHVFRIRAETDTGLSAPSIPISYSPRRGQYHRTPFYPFLSLPTVKLDLFSFWRLAVG